ncbi:MAG: cupin domain-containing protein [Bacillota bacterium]|nr:cupin domain-containing protein [Bacillota bacterium]
MIKRSSEHKIELAEKVFGEEGHVIFKRIIEAPEELYGKGRVFSVVTLEKDCGLGYHMHKGDGEYYYALSGEAEYNDNGHITTLKAGDTAFCPDGEGHAIVNHSDEPFVFIALIVYN